MKQGQNKINKNRKLSENSVKTMERVEVCMKLAHTPDMSFPFLTRGPEPALLSKDL